MEPVHMSGYTLEVDGDSTFLAAKLRYSPSLVGLGCQGALPASLVSVINYLNSVLGC